MPFLRSLPSFSSALPLPRHQSPESCLCRSRAAFCAALAGPVQCVACRCHTCLPADFDAEQALMPLCGRLCFVWAAIHSYSELRWPASLDAALPAAPYHLSAPGAAIRPGAVALQLFPSFSPRRRKLVCPAVPGRKVPALVNPMPWLSTGLWL
jgi:hypothetical protein